MKIKLQSALLFASLSLAALPAFGQSADGQCASDADCPNNFSCETTEWSECAPCADVDNCPPCETGSESYCVPPPPEQCDENSPCTGDNVCVTYTFEVCSGGGAVPACHPDESCPPAPDEEEEFSCESSEESYCVPPYFAPCSADADCGAGFTCETAEVCECSGGTMSSDGEPAPDETDPCTCAPSGDSYCQLIEVECDTDADCAGALTCQESAGEPRPAIGCVEGESCPVPEPADPTSHCAPEGYGYYGGASPDGASYDVAAAAGRDEASVTNSEREEFFPVAGESGGGKSDPGCSSVSANPSGSLLAMAMLFLFGRRRK